ncbi:MAG: sulfurtransferase TusA family protein [Alphaproteobacteria bacterium]|jgi:tRNA 2-thiouridine synthesizing protein A
MSKPQTKVTGATYTLNIKGANCPIPVVWAKKQMDCLATGDTLEVLATDPDAVTNFQTFARSTGHELLECTEEGGVIRLLIRKTA